MITSANAIVMFSVSDVFDTPQQLQQFSADDIFSTEDQERNQTMMGVDGYQTGGKVFLAVVQTFNLMADSISMDIFEEWMRQEDVNVETYKAQATVQLPSLQQKWTCTNGIMVRAQRMPTAAKVLQPRHFVISWERVVEAAY